MKILEREQMNEEQKAIFDFFDKPLFEISVPLTEIVALFKEVGIIVE